MGKFEVGNKMGGRKVGSLNRSTEQAKLAIARLANQGLNNITEDFEKIRKENPIEAAKLYLKLLEYIVPKKSSIDITGEIDHRIQQVSININRADSEHRD
jgi:predicted nucleotide-binding protein (sugar kinase/HSP70/actin superfamily)